VTLGLSDKELAALLNEKGLLSPTGVQWTATAVSKALWKLRHHRTVGSTLHTQLLQLAFDGVLDPDEVRPLYSARPPRMTM